MKSIIVRWSRNINAILLSLIKNSPTVRLILLTAVLLGARPGQAGAPSWIGPSQMTQARFLHSATLLPNGKVLVAGGLGPGIGNWLATAELFDPTTLTWLATAPMMMPRISHTAVLLPDGRVLVTGAFSYDESGRGAGDSTAELYHPATSTWAPTRRMIVPRLSPTATLLLNGKVLVVGGNPEEITAELYDPATESWTLAQSMNISRNVQSAILLPNGKVLIIGSSGAELYDPVAGTWSITGSLNTPRHSFSTTLLENGTVLVAGGSLPTGDAVLQAELYDPASGLWTPTGSLRVGRPSTPMTLCPDGKVLMAGGSSAERYDPITGQWTDTVPLPGSRSGHTATLMADGTVLMAGGLILDPLRSAIFLDTSVVYDPGLGYYGLPRVPDLIGLNHTSAESAILAANLKVGAVTIVFSDTVPVGDVINQGPTAGSYVLGQSSVDLLISEGPTSLPTPLSLFGRAKLSHVNLRWLPSAQAVRYLIFRRLNFETTFSQIGVAVAAVYVNDIPRSGVFAEYYVIAENEFGRSEPSAHVIVAPTQR